MEKLNILELETKIISWIYFFLKKKDLQFLYSLEDIERTILDNLSPSDFTYPDRRGVYSYIRDIYKKNGTIEEHFLEIKREIEKRGVDFLEDLQKIGHDDFAPHIAREVIKELKKSARTERLKKRLLEIQDRLDQEEEISKILGSIRDLDIETDLVFDNWFIRSEDFKQQLEEEKKNIYGTGIEDIDSLLGGGIRRKLYVMAGCPNIGKTTLFNQIADNLAVNKIPVLYVHTEESDLTLWEKTNRRLEYLMNTEKKDIGELGNKIYQYKYSYTFTKDITFDDFYFAVRRLKKQVGNLVLFIDSLQAFPSDDKNKPLREQIGNKIVFFKRLSEELKIPVLVISIMARDKYLDVSFGAFKEAGEIEYYVDVGLVLTTKPPEAKSKEWGEENHQDELKKDDPEIYLYCIKNRNGKTGCKKLIFKNHTIFKDVNSEYRRNF